MALRAQTSCAGRARARLYVIPGKLSAYGHRLLPWPELKRDDFWYGVDRLRMDRLNRVAKQQTVRLTHYRRKSGKAYEVTIWFAAEGDRIYLQTANVNRQSVRNVQKTPRVRLSIGE